MPYSQALMPHASNSSGEARIATCTSFVAEVDSVQPPLFVKLHPSGLRGMQLGKESRLHAGNFRDFLRTCNADNPANRKTTKVFNTYSRNAFEVGDNVEQCQCLYATKTRVFGWYA